MAVSGGPVPAPGDALVAARDLAPSIEAWSARIEAARELPPEVLTALHEAGLFRLMLPRGLGGSEIDLPRFFEVIETVARADASTAWCLGQAAGCAMMAAYLPPPAAAEIFGSPGRDVLAWGPPSAGAQAVAVAGGYRVSGSWNFASGLRHATWLGAHQCPIIEPDGTPRRDGEGKPVQRILIFPKASATVTDVWQVIGLKGTGSDNYAVADLFVPQDHTVSRDDPAERREGGTLYRFQTLNIYSVAFPAVALGIARAMLDAYMALARTKIPMTARSVLRDLAVVQSQIGIAEARLRAARIYMLASLREIWDAVAAAGGITVDQRMAIRLAASHAFQQAQAVADMAYHGAGASAIFENGPFERRFRDLNAVSQQVQAHGAHFETVGQYLLGLPPNLMAI